MNTMRVTLIWCLLAVSGAALLSGCSGLGHVDELWLLKQYGDEADAMDVDVDAAEARFQSILDDSRNGQLDQRLDRQTVRSRYGEPVYVQVPSEEPGTAEMWMYRRPVHFFDSDQVLLYFNKEGYLVSHAVKDHQPASGD